MTETSQARAMEAAKPLETPHLSTSEIFATLTDAGLLRETIRVERDSAGTPQAIWSLDETSLPQLTLTEATYDSRRVNPRTLLFCKGAFKADYMEQAAAQGLTCYVAESEYSAKTDALGFIVTDVRKAMALLAAAFYRHPEKRLTITAITGTKGKTTTAYYAHAVLNAWTGGKTAMMSSEQTCLDGTHWFDSELTTPESLDSLRMMRQAVDNGMTHLVMEISSQAYKIDRVYGLTFDVGAFLNISPDHISPIEHPTFEDYFYCKRKLIANSRKAVVNAALGWKTDLIEQTAKLAGTPISTYSADPAVPADAMGNVEGSGESESVSIRLADGTNLGRYTLAMDGAFNDENALAAIAIAIAAGADPHDPKALASFHALETVTVPGRMQKFVTPEGTIAYVDYAHNYLSLKALLDFARATYPGAFVTVVTGTAGGKAIDRREGMAKAASESADRFICTDEDSNFEDPHAISEEMASYVTNPAVDTRVIDGRETAIRAAFDLAAADHRQTGRTNIVLVIGKGDEAWLKIKGKRVPITSDLELVRQISKGQAQ